MYKIVLLIFFTTFSLWSLESKAVAQNDEWILDRVNFYFEDDVYTHTDDGYSAGERLSFLWYIPDENYTIYDTLFLDYGPSYSYFTFALTNQIFTPTDTNSKTLIENDRPYAGWSYAEFGMHKSSKKHLRSLLIKIGIIGSSSYSKEIQNNFHALIGNDYTKGWGNQLNNEIGVNLKYTHKWMLLSKSNTLFESSLVPFVEGELGNIAINAKGGVNTRIGYNIPKDFSVSSIDYGADPGIPAYDEYQNMKKLPWSFSLNFSAAASVVERDIFLDGNSFGKSHSVEKEPFIYYYGFGFTVRYKDFSFDFIEIRNSKRFITEKSNGHGVGTMVFTWLF